MNVNMDLERIPGDSVTVRSDRWAGWGIPAGTVVAYDPTTPAWPAKQSARPAVLVVVQLEDADGDAGSGLGLGLLGQLWRDGVFRGAETLKLLPDAAGWLLLPVHGIEVLGAVTGIGRPEGSATAHCGQCGLSRCVCPPAGMEGAA